MPIFNRYWPHQQTTIPNPDALQLQNRGPSLQVEISLNSILAAQYQQSGTSLPAPLTGYALIDTGASVTSVDAKILESLGIKAVGQIPISTPSGSSQQGLYSCQFSFPGTPIPVLPFVSVVGSILQPQGIVALIGRDLLRNFLLIYDGVHGSWTLSF